MHKVSKEYSPLFCADAKECAVNELVNTPLFIDGKQRFLPRLLAVSIVSRVAHHIHSELCTEESKGDKQG